MALFEFEIKAKNVVVKNYSEDRFGFFDGIAKMLDIGNASVPTMKLPGVYDDVCNIKKDSDVLRNNMRKVLEAFLLEK